MLLQATASSCLCRRVGRTAECALGSVALFDRGSPGCATDRGGTGGHAEAAVASTLAEDDGLLVAR